MRPAVEVGAVRRQGMRWAAWGLVALAVLAIVGRLDALSVGPSVDSMTATPTTREAPPPRTTLPVPVAKEPAGLPETPVRAAFGRDVLWVAGRRAVYHVLAKDGYQAATEVRSHTGGVLDVATGAGGVWLAVNDPGSVWRLDSAGIVVARISLGRALTGTVRIAVSGGAGQERVWVACCGREDGTVLLVDPATNRVVGMVPMPNGPTAIAADDREAVVTTQLNEVVVISARTGAARVVMRNSPGSLLRDVALTDDAAWFTVPGRDVVLRRDRAGGRIQAYRLPHGVRALAAARRGVWALSEDGLSITPLDKGSLPPFALLPTGDDPARQLVLGRNALWLVPERGPEVVRVFFPENPELSRV
jgi:streptogramin lyase